MVVFGVAVVTMLVLVMMVFGWLRCWLWCWAC
jgi:hypothetical protein